MEGIKVTVSGKVGECEVGYPCYRIYMGGEDFLRGRVFLFTAPKQATALDCKTSSVSGDVFLATKVLFSSFIPFRGKITIEVE